MLNGLTGASRRRRVAGWIALLATTIGVGVVGAPACALVAGLEDHTVEPPDADAGGTASTAASTSNGTESTTTSTASAGGAGTTSTSASSGNTGSGGADGGGGMTPVGGWPDSPTAYCSSDVASIMCPTAAAASYHDQDGDFLIDVPTYQTTANHVVDSVTGLMWRRPPIVGLDQPSAITECKTQSFDGHDDWRLPSRLELVSLVDYGNTGARIDHTAFPDVTATLFWSASKYPQGGGTTTVWAVDFGCSGSCTPNGSGTGNTYGAYNGTPTSALCVRGAPLVAGDFTPASNGTITDKSTGLMWQVSAAPTGFMWLEALHNCRDVVNGDNVAGFSDWRLPSIKELQTLVDDTAAKSPALLPGLVTGPEAYLWSSTPDTDVLSPVHAYLLAVFDGSTTTLTLDQNYGYARCVRGQ